MTLFDSWNTYPESISQRGPYGAISPQQRALDLQSAQNSLQSQQWRDAMRGKLNQTYWNTALGAIPPGGLSGIEGATIQEKIQNYYEANPEASAVTRGGTPGTGTSGSTDYGSGLSQNWLNMLGGGSQGYFTPSGGGGGAPVNAGTSAMTSVPATAPGFGVGTPQKIDDGVLNRGGAGTSATGAATSSGGTGSSPLGGAPGGGPSNTVVSPNILPVPQEIMSGVKWLLNPTPDWSQTDSSAAERAVAGGYSGSGFASNQNLLFRESELKDRMKLGADILDPYLQRQQGALNIYTQGGIESELAKQKGQIDRDLTTIREAAADGRLDRNIAADLERTLLNNANALELARLNARTSTQNTLLNTQTSRANALLNSNSGGGYTGGSDSGPNQATIDYYNANYA